MGKSSSVVQWIDRKLYPQYESHWDDRLFRKVIDAHIRPEDTLLDLGAGRGIVAAMNFQGCVKRACGIDVVEEVTSNPYLDEGKVARGEEIPYPDATFDIVVSDNVLEHLENPQQVFREVNRVLKPGGFFITKTPNRWHYMPLIASLTPTAFHRWYNRIRGRSVEDTFPTQYRANSPGDQRQIARQSGFEVESIQLIEGRPEYLRIQAILYLFGVVYERLVNSCSCWSRFRILLVSVFRKPV